MDAQDYADLRSLLSRVKRDFRDDSAFGVMLGETTNDMQAWGTAITQVNALQTGPHINQFFETLHPGEYYIMSLNALADRNDLQHPLEYWADQIYGRHTEGRSINNDVQEVANTLTATRAAQAEGYAPGEIIITTNTQPHNGEHTRTLVVSPQERILQALIEATNRHTPNATINVAADESRDGHAHTYTIPHTAAIDMYIGYIQAERVESPNDYNLSPDTPVDVYYAVADEVALNNDTTGQARAAGLIAGTWYRRHQEVHPTRAYDSAHPVHPPANLQLVDASPADSLTPSIRAASATAGSGGPALNQ